jgi:3-phosphoglycerate kinase
MPSSGGGWVGSPIPPVKKKKPSHAWWLSAIVPTLGRLRQEDPKVKVNLSHTARPSHKRRKARKLRREWMSQFCCWLQWERF